MPEARDEYHSYVWRIVGMLLAGADEAAIAAELGSITSSAIGLRSRPHDEARVAEVLLHWLKALRVKHHASG